MVAASIALLKTTFKESGYQITIRSTVRFWICFEHMNYLIKKKGKNILGLEFQHISYLLCFGFKEIIIV